MEFSCSFVVMTMHSFSHILDLCPLTLSSNVLAHPPPSSSSPHYSQTSHQTPDKSEFQLLIFFSCACHRIRHQNCVSPDCSFVSHYNLLTAITDSRLCLLLALLFCLLLAVLLLHRFLGPLPWRFFFFFLKKKSLKLSPLTATRNLCRPRFVTTLDIMHCLHLQFIDNS